MKRILILVVAMTCSIQFADAQKKTAVINPNIDMQGYLKVAGEAAEEGRADIRARGKADLPSPLVEAL